jgi:ClpP class serine protease
MGIEAASGLMSYGEIEARLDAALADPQVAGILLDLDSPGGEASGVFELAERIRAASPSSRSGRTPTMPRTRRPLPSRLPASA